LSGQVSPGQKIHTGKGSRMFSMSIETFQEECSALNHSGLLSRYRPDEWSIRWLSDQEAAERFDILGSLSILISQAVVSNAASDDIDKLSSFVTIMDICNCATEADGFLATKLRFYETLLKIAGNAFLCRLYLRTMKELRLYYLQGLENNFHSSDIMLLDNRAINKCHRALIQAMKVSNVPRVLVALREEVAESRDQSMKVVNRYVP